jgi:DNA-binding NtrC family response regulator
MSAETQSKLLRVIQERTVRPVGSTREIPVNARLIASTNRDPEEAVRAGDLRADLYYRLQASVLQVPPLRERREDIPPLAIHFLRRYASRYRREIDGFEPSALQFMRQYSWPGNVRELEHTLERAVLMCRGREIQAADLGLNLQRSQAQNLEELSLEAVEAVLIRKALQRFQGNISQAAEALGLSRGALYRRMEKYGL